MIIKIKSYKGDGRIHPSGHTWINEFELVDDTVDTIGKEIVKKMLFLNAIEFNFHKLYRWSSGIESPIYCDNRISLSDNFIRTMLLEGYINLIVKHYPNVELIAGVATGAIGMGTLVAHELGLPFVYIREKQKEHGKRRMIEGRFEKNAKTVIIEDVVSTGGSSLRALKEMRNACGDVLGLITAFSYDFPEAIEGFKDNECEMYSICNFDMVRNIAHVNKYICNADLIKLNAWYSNPKEYNKLQF